MLDELVLILGKGPYLNKIHVREDDLEGHMQILDMCDALIGRRHEQLESYTMQHTHSFKNSSYSGIIGGIYFTDDAFLLTPRATAIRYDEDNQGSIGSILIFESGHITMHVSNKRLIGEDYGTYWRSSLVEEDHQDAMPSSAEEAYERVLNDIMHIRQLSGGFPGHPPKNTMMLKEISYMSHQAMRIIENNMRKYSVNGEAKKI